MRVVWGGEAMVSAFVANLARIPRGFGPCRTASVVRSDGEMIAGVVFHNYQPEAGVIECSAAAIDARWASRSVVKQLMHYVFGKVECQMLVGRTAPENTRTRRLWKALGATEYEIPRLRGRHKSEVVMCIADDAWRNSSFAR